MNVRPATRHDQEAIVALRGALWPDATPDEHRTDVASILSGRPRSTLPLVIFVAEQSGAVGAGGEVIGFVEVGLRSHADGCDPSRPCGFLEGWYVEPAYVRRGVGRALVESAERWVREQGCTELASDTWLDREASQRAHEALGFAVVDRCVNYRKSLE